MEQDLTRKKPGTMNNQSFTSRRRSDALPPPPPHAICEALQIKEITIEWLAGDGSDRCYYRLMSPSLDHSLVLMQLSDHDAKALRENGYEWIQIGDILGANGIFVPKTVVTMPEYAAIIIEDYGDLMMESVAKTSLADGLLQDALSLYKDSFDILVNFLKIQGNAEAPWCRRRFDSERFQWELNFFRKEFLEPVAGIQLSANELATFQEETITLSDFLAQYSNYFVHRDFHSRNIMVEGKKLAVIDFQDARYGPAAYDLVSLCYDSYVPFNNESRLHLLEEGIKSIEEYDPNLGKEIRTHWKPTLLQRQIKAIGSFGYLSIKKNRGDYLKYVRPALQTLMESSVFDARWPFLSSELLKRIDRSMG